MNYFIKILTTGFFSLSIASQADTFHDRFSMVNQNIYRGSMPSEANFRELKKLGIKTVLNFQTTPDVIKREKKWAKKNGMHFISIPMSSLFFIRPSQDLVDQILEAESDPRNYPMYVHCRHGQDRTGFAIGLYRWSQEQWKAEHAYEEMKVFGYKSELNIGLNCAFWERTGMEYPKSCELVAPWEG